MNNKLEFIEEPFLEFGYSQKATDPRNGLALFGPYDFNHPSRPGKINHAVIGSEVGVGMFKRWSKHWVKPIMPEKDMNPKIWPFFPGIEAVFDIQWDTNPIHEKMLDINILTTAVEEKDLNSRVKKVVDLYVEQLKQLNDSDERIDLVICMVPNFVFQNCRPKSVGKKRKPKKNPQMSLFGNNDDEEELASDFRRQIKARAMDFNIPIKIIRESTLALTKEEVDEAYLKYKHGVTPASDRAWNIATTANYKAGGKPWKLSGVRDGVCYIGLAFRLTPDRISQNGKLSACCAAQMFLKDGDGVVFKGDDGLWYSPETKIFHLDKTGAEKLLKGVLQSYQTMGGKPLTEVFVHCPSGLSEEEYKGFCEAVPKGTKVIVVRIKRDTSFRLLRKGEWPIPRGSFMQISNTSGYLWASGFKFELSTYDGTEVPVPLKIDILYGESDISTVAKDILGLTKLNYNACKYGESDPVTIKFADAVGEILVSNNIQKAKPQFKYYI